MKRSTIVLILILIVGLLSPDAGKADRRQGFGTPDNFQIRAETHLKCRTTGYSYASGDISGCFDAGLDPEFKFDLDQQSYKLPAKSGGFVDIPRMASRFVAPNSGTMVAITFSAMHFVLTIEDQPLLVRAIVDGVEAEPGPITFTAGFDSTRFSSQSFTFTTVVEAGMHIVQIQYSSEATSHNSFLRNASLFITMDSQNNNAHRVSAKGGRLRSAISKSDTGWTAIPQAEVTFNVPEQGETALTFSSVVKMTKGDFILLRAVIDGGASAGLPAENTLVARSYHYGARSLTFTTGELSPGTHKARFEWKSSSTDVVAGALMSAWSATAITAPRETKDTFFDVVLQTVADDTTSAQFELVANLQSEVEVNALSDVAVMFSAAYDGPGVVIATVTNDGVPVSEQETIIYEPAIKIDEKNNNSVLVDDAGGRSYTFAIKDLAPREAPYQIGVAFRVIQAGVTIPASATVYNGTLTVLRKTRVGADLAVGANMGSSSKKHESLIEPVHGSRKVVAIIFDPDRTDAPEPDRDFRGGIERVLFGATPSAADYYKVVSGNRFMLEEVAVLGPYKGDKAGGATGQNHYWDGAAHDPNADEDCSDSTDKYCSPWLEQQAEALLKASEEFDFSTYDLDRDGTIAPNELGILVVTPQNSSGGSNTNRSFSPYANGDPFIVNGVVIRSLIHWYSPGIGDGTNTLVGLESSMTATHEMAHLFLNLDDVYGPYKGIFDGTDVQPCPEGGDPACQTRFMSTAPHPVSLMTYKTINSSPHIDGFHKLQLGWVTPRIIAQPGDFNLIDVRQSGEVFVLPRYGTDGREYILLESRYTNDLLDDAGYDFSIGDDGLAVYHVIEPGLACQAEGGAQGPSCVPLLKPMCLTSDLLWDAYFSNFVRLGLRLIQPDLTHERIDGVTNFGETLFGTNAGTELLDEAPGGAALCPTNIGDPLPAGGVPLLLWADGSASGYRLKMIKLDYTGKSVSFTTEITGQ